MNVYVLDSMCFTSAQSLEECSQCGEELPFSVLAMKLYCLIANLELFNLLLEFVMMDKSSDVEFLSKITATYLN